VSKKRGRAGRYKSTARGWWQLAGRRVELLLRVFRRGTEPGGTWREGCIRDTASGTAVVAWGAELSSPGYSVHYRAELPHVAVVRTHNYMPCRLLAAKGKVMLPRLLSSGQSGVNGEGLALGLARLRVRMPRSRDARRLADLWLRRARAAVAGTAARGYLALTPIYRCHTRYP
jgi:hypothetical protein